MKTKVWVAVMSPFKDDHSIDEQGIIHNVNKYVELGLDGMFFNGLMGENWALSRDDREQVARYTVKAAKGKIPTCAVASLDSVEDTISLGRSYKEIGLDYCCLIAPRNIDDPKAVVARVQEWMEGIDMPFVLFNAVTNDGRSVLTPDMFATLIQNKNIKILKTTTSDEVNNSLRVVAGDQVMVSDPTEEKFFVNATKNNQRLLFADPEPYLYQTPDFKPIHKYIELIEAGKLDEARVIFEGLEPYRKIFNKWLMIPFYKGIMTTAALKKWASMCGFATGPVRKPLNQLTAAEDKEMEKDILAARDAVMKSLGGKI